MKITLIICQKKNTSTTRTNGGSIPISRRPTTHRNNTTTTPHGERQRQRQRQRQTGTVTVTDRGDGREEDKTTEERRFIFCVECFVLFIPSTPDSLACQTVSSTIHLSFQRILAGQQFLNFCELFILCSYIFCLCSYSFEIFRIV